MFDAATKGCEERCKRMIDQAGKVRSDVELDGWGNRNGVTPLIVAAFYGKTHCVKVLAEKEAGMCDSSG